MASPRSAQPARRGYTLLELLIVVAVVAVVVGVSWPALQRPAEKSKLRAAARQLRIALARTRLEAIRSGTAQEFRYQPGSGAFTVSPRATSEEGGGFTPVSFGQSEEVESLGGDFADSEPAPYALPAGIRFFDPTAPDAVPDESEPVVSTESRGWSAPIVFYPNGRSFNAWIRLHGRYNYYVDVTLRGLTGAGKVGQVQRFEEPSEDSFVGPIEESS